MTYTPILYSVMYNLIRTPGLLCEDFTGSKVRLLNQESQSIPNSSLTNSFHHLLIYQFIYSSIYSFVCLLLRIYSFLRSSIHSFIHKYFLFSFAHLLRSLSMSGNVLMISLTCFIVLVFSISSSTASNL